MSTPTGRLLCRHCCQRFANRPRGLCSGCYYRPGVRGLYGPIGPRGRRGEGQDFNGRGADAEPTSAMPGTEEKIAVLAERARLKQAMFHPADAGLPRDESLPSRRSEGGARVYLHGRVWRDVDDSASQPWAGDV